jgi:glycosyltransferase involved in cell wall biosynthesis
MGVVEAWRKAGHHVDIVSPPGVNPEHLERPRGNRGRPTTLGWLARRVPGFFFELMELVYNIRGFVVLWFAHRRRRYDLVYERYAYLNVAGLVTAKLARVPFVLEVNFTSSTVMTRRRSRAARFLELRIERSLFPRADGCVAVSSKLKSLLLESGVDEARVLVQPNAADPGQFDPLRRADALRNSLGLHGRPVVGFVGYFSAWHGVRLLCQGFESVRARFPDVAYVLVGDGPTHAEISGMVRDRGWERSILLAGRIPHDAVPDYVALFDVAVMPHSNDYGSPMKIPEYMAAGRPVVAPRLGPIEELVEHGHTGLLFEPGSSADLVAAITELLSNEERRASIGRAARRRVEESLNWDGVAERILTFAERRVSHDNWNAAADPAEGTSGRRA